LNTDPPRSIDRIPAAAHKDSSAQSSDQPDRPPSANFVTTASVDLRSPTQPETIEAATLTADRQLESASTPPRREVLNAMRALREMPPFAREREIEHGRYSHFSPEERELLRHVDQ